MPNIFMSYSHDDNNWVRNWLLPELEKNGLETHIDYRDFEIGVPSVINMERAVEQCTKTLLVLTPNWVRSEFTQFEGIMLQSEDPIGLRKKILPLMLEDCQLPRRLNILTYADFRNKKEWHFQIGRLVQQIKKDFALVESAKPSYPSIAEKNVSVQRLPRTGYELLGRQKELELLNQAWETKETHILSFVAYGGVGKTTLLNKWNERMRWDNYRGAQKVFAWSFYSQGTNERVTSDDLFITTALEWFGDRNQEQASPWDRGKRLAKLIRHQKTLLILDGIEPLQSTHEVEAGKIKDTALSTLVTELAKDNNGLCVITTRVKVRELDRHPKTSQQVNLEKISNEAAIALLRLRGVQGADKELLRQISNLDNHTLAVNLLGGYLREFPGHHISHAESIPNIDTTEKTVKQPQRLMSAFAQLFGQGPEVELLYVLGLFDHPPELAAIDSVREAPAIPGLTEYLSQIDKAALIKICQRLRYCQLLAPQSHHNPDVVDCHPLLREHFGGQLHKANPEAWRLVHNRLYEYFKNSSKKEFPDTLIEMQPVFTAIVHGCQAARHEDALHIYWEKVQRKKEAYTALKLGAIEADLSVLSSFFALPWERPADTLKDSDKAKILGWVGFRLRALGHLYEAIQPIEKSLDLFTQLEDYENASTSAAQLCELFLTTGDLRLAVDYGDKGVELAELSKNEHRIMNEQTTVADALHKAGHYQKANSFFQKAEELQASMQPDRPILYSYWGFRYCDFLLSMGKHNEVINRVKTTLGWSKSDGILLGVAVEYLSLGRAYLSKASNDNPDELGVAADFLNQAVLMLRESSQQDELPKGLLSRCALYRIQNRFSEAWSDLEEAREIAERGQMGLHLADCHLEASRLFFAEDKQIEARNHFDIATEMVQRMGYGRRRPEIQTFSFGDKN